MECPGCGVQLGSDPISIAIETKGGIHCQSCDTTINHDRIVFAVARTLTRKNHPLTSLEAAKRIVYERREKQLQALAFVRQHPGRTVGELSHYANNESRRTIGRRLPELEEKGLVKRGETRTCQITQRKAATWYPVGSLQPS